MRLTICLLTALLSLISHTLANDVSLSDIERAMMSLVTKVRGEQVRHSVPTVAIQEEHV